MDFSAASASALPRFRFHQNVVILLVAFPPTYLEATDKTNRFRYQNPAFHLFLWDLSRVSPDRDFAVPFSAHGSVVDIGRPNDDDSVIDDQQFWMDVDELRHEAPFQLLVVPQV